MLLISLCVWQLLPNRIVARLPVENGAHDVASNVLRFAAPPGHVFEPLPHHEQGRTRAVPTHLFSGGVEPSALARLNVGLGARTV